MKAKILIKVTMSNIISKETLDKEYDGNLAACVRHMIEEEGHFIGLVDDKYEIVSVEQE